MWLALLLALWNGGTMSDQQQKPSVVGPALVPVAPVVEPIDPRTLADVEADMTRVARILVAHRARQGHTVNVHECNEGKPALPTRELNWLHDEWVALNANG